MKDSKTLLPQPPFDVVQNFDTRDVKYRLSSGDGIELVEIAGILPSFPNYFSVDRYVLQFIVSGEMSAQINLQDVHLSAPCAIALIPDFILHFDKASADCRAFVVSFTNNIVEQMNLIDMPYRVANALHRAPYSSLTETQMGTARKYFELLKENISDAGNPFSHEAAVLLLKALIRNLQGMFSTRFVAPKRMTRSEELTDDFLTLAEKECVRERSVDYYADRLHVSPKYLANVVKESTGRTLGDWLDGYTLLRAKALLNTSRMNIQQIAEALNFANQSHFGTWFRRHAGVSPKNFRV
ncbi:MAG: AraC family transcriptional regulator [Paludibacteraceae bacterium]|nr:AraC family transcriptional regulator [Paludibacteraceae bacterium]